jgi:hypothetical protein
MLDVDAGGAVANTRFEGLFWGYQLGNSNADHATLFQVTNPATNATTAFEVSGELAQSNGSVLTLTGPDITHVTLHLDGPGVFGQSTTAGTYYFANINAANALVTIQGSKVNAFTGTGSTWKGVLVTAATSVEVTGTHFNGISSPIDPASSGAPIVFAGNGMTNTASTYDEASCPAGLVVAGNSPDKPNPACSFLTNQLASNVAMNNTSNFFDGPSEASPWPNPAFVAQVTLQDTVAASFECKAWDGTTVAASGVTTSLGAGNPVMIPLSGVFPGTPAGNIRVSCRDITSTSGTINAAGAGAGNTASSITLQRPSQ